ncbi:MAG: GSCFA domain-containing protein [Janthinobacterium lividum]
MFRTELTIAPQERQLPRSARVLTVGSCFADSMGERLRLNKIAALINPFGTVFQPLALAKLLRAAAGEAQDWQQHVVEARGRWQSFDFHGTLGADSPVELLQTIQQQVQRVGDFLRQTDLVVLTLGTAWAYRLRETDELVSNLHKLPAQLFVKELLTADEIVNSLAEVHALLRRIKPNICIALTVSPVRHLKDTLPLNAVSKSVLRVACHYLSELLPGVSYFPAYELLNDDLRDYRFYASDMLHPSEAAEEYIWDRFARAYFDADFGRFRKEWAAVRQSLTHRPLHLGAPEHRTFLDQTAERLERLVSQGVEVRQELRDVQRQLATLPPPRPVRQSEPLPEDDGEERIDIGGQETALLLVPSLSPPAEDQRESRGRNRRGRGRDRRAEQPAAAPAEAVPATDYPAEMPDELAEEVFIGDELLEENPTEDTELLEEADLAEPDDTGASPAKKKKRRSRGGAKRTARKNAARLAAEQLLDTAENLPIDEATGTIDAGPAEELSLLAAVIADNLLAAETNAELASTTTPGAPDPLGLAPLPEPATDAAETETVGATPARKRGTGPTPKKSKVITKSSQVKRPKRASLFRNAGTSRVASDKGLVTSETVSSESLDAPVQAPIISTPILPEALLERPAVAELIENPAVLATTATELLPAATAKPRRGRPKAAPAAMETSPAASAPSANPATEATETPPRAKRTAKPKAASAAPRRGRPPSKKNPPASENSAG